MAGSIIYPISLLLNPFNPITEKAAATTANVMRETH